MEQEPLRQTKCNMNINFLYKGFELSSLEISSLKNNPIRLNFNHNFLSFFVIQGILLQHPVLWVNISLFSCILLKLSGKMGENTRKLRNSRAFCSKKNEKEVNTVGLLFKVSFFWATDGKKIGLKKSKSHKSRVYPNHQPVIYSLSTPRHCQIQQKDMVFVQSKKIKQKSSI